MFVMSYMYILLSPEKDLNLTFVNEFSDEGWVGGGGGGVWWCWVGGSF